MGVRKVIVRHGAAERIAAISWYIESLGLVETAEKFADDVYDYFIKMGDKRKSYPLCKEANRALLGYKCIPYKKKFTIVFIESERQLIICEFIYSKLVYW